MACLGVCLIAGSTSMFRRSISIVCLLAGQSQGVAFALPMPQPGEMPSYVFLGQAKTRYPPIWSVYADIECNG